MSIKTVSNGFNDTRTFTTACTFNGSLSRFIYRKEISTIDFNCWQTKTCCTPSNVFTSYRVVMTCTLTNAVKDEL